MCGVLALGASGCFSNRVVVKDAFSWGTEATPTAVAIDTEHRPVTTVVGVGDVRGLVDEAAHAVAADVCDDPDAMSPRAPLGRM